MPKRLYCFLFVVINSFFYSTISAHPVIHQAINANPASIKLPDIDGKITGWSCANDGKDSVCSAIGLTNANKPILYVSENGSGSWQEVTIPDLHIRNTTAFSGISCTGSGKSALCVVIGNYDTRYEAFLAQSRDGGKTWQVQTFTNAHELWDFRSVSCAGSSDTAFCAVGGLDNGVYALVVTTSDGGQNWNQVKQIDGIPFPVLPDGFDVATCMQSPDSWGGRSHNAICLLQGETIFDQDTGEAGPYYAYTINNGTTWHGGKGVTGS